MNLPFISRKRHNQELARATKVNADQLRTMTEVARQFELTREALRMARAEIGELQSALKGLAEWGMGILPAYNLEAERGLLGGMIVDNSKIPIIAQMFKEAAGDLAPVFFDPLNQEIWQAILLANAVNPDGRVDLVKVGEVLDAHGRYEAIGADYLASLEDGIVSTLYLADYAQIVIEKWRDRDLYRRLMRRSTRRSLGSMG